MEAVRRPEPTCIRVRRGRIDPRVLCDRLEAQGFTLDPVRAGGDVFTVVGAPRTIARTLEHWLGWFYIQQASTALAAPALGPRPGERVLDMAAAPGGKMTHLAELMEDRGSLVACDASEKRIRGLLGNLYRTAHTGVAVLSGDARSLGDGVRFDRVLLDAPCSGEGTLRRRGGEVSEPPADYVEHIVGLQRALLVRAVDLLRPGGTVLYSTCTFNPDENEAVVDHVLRAREGELEVEPIPLDAPHASGATAFEGRRFHPDLERAWRIYPHHLDSGGLFLCRIRRKGIGPVEGWRALPRSYEDAAGGAGAAGESSDAGAAGDTLERAVRSVEARYGVRLARGESARFFTRGDSTWLTTADAWAPDLWATETGVRLVSLGLRALKLDGRIGALRPTNDLLQWLDQRIERSVIEPDRAGWVRLLERRPFEAGGCDDGFVALRLEGRVVGRGLILDGNLRHEIPKARAKELARILDETVAIRA